MRIKIGMVNLMRQKMVKVGCCIYVEYFIQTSMPWSLAGLYIQGQLYVMVYIWILGVRFIYVGLTRPNDLCGTPFFPLLSRLDMNQGSCPFGQ